MQNITFIQIILACKAAYDILLWYIDTYFVPGIFSGRGAAKSIVMEISFAVLTFLSLLDKISGRGQTTSGAASCGKAMIGR